MLFQPNNVDVVILATLADNHLALIRILSEAGFRHILCEKPVVNQIRDLRALSSLVREKNLHLAINHPKLWSQDFELARAIVQSGFFGPLKRISLRFKSGGFGNIGCHQLASLFYITGKSVSRVVSAEFDPSSGVSRKKDYLDPNGRAVFDLDGIPVDIDNRKKPVSPPNRICFFFEHVMFELLEEFNLFRFMDFRTGEDHHQFFKLPWLGTKKSWPVIVHLLRNAILEVASGNDPAKFQRCCECGRNDHCRSRRPPQLHLPFHFTPRALTTKKHPFSFPDSMAFKLQKPLIFGKDLIQKLRDLWRFRNFESKNLSRPIQLAVIGSGKAAAYHLEKLFG